jgi:hypothetical protein
MPRQHTLTDDVLRTTVAQKLEAGASTEQIGRIIKEFLSGTGSDTQQGIDRDLLIREIPHNRRAEFFAAISLLAV